MTVDFDVAALHPAWDALRAIMTTAHALPIMACVKCQVRPDGAVLLGVTNRHASLIVPVPGAVSSTPGSFAIPSAPFSELLAVVRDGRLSVGHDSAALLVRHGAARWRVPTFDVSTYPALAGLAAPDVARVDARSFREALVRCLKARGPDVRTDRQASVAVEIGPASRVTACGGGVLVPQSFEADGARADRGPRGRNQRRFRAPQGRGRPHHPGPRRRQLPRLFARLRVRDGHPWRRTPSPGANGPSRPGSRANSPRPDGSR